MTAGREQDARETLAAVVVRAWYESSGWDVDDADPSTAASMAAAQPSGLAVLDAIDAALLPSPPATTGAGATHRPFTDDGVTYCGWDGHEGCGEVWPCSTEQARLGALRPPRPPTSPPGGMQG